MAQPKAILTLTYHELARRLVMHQEVEQIAQGMALSPNQVKAAMLRPEFTVILDQVRDKAYEGVDKQIQSETRNIAQEIKDASGDSLDRLKSLLEGSSDTIGMHVAQDLLDRAGHGGKQVAAPLTQIIINPIEADVLATALKKEREGEARLRDLVVDADKLDHPAIKRDSPASVSMNPETPKPEGDKE